MESLHAERQKCTELEIDFSDSVIVNLRHANGNIGVFVADTVSRKATTSLEVIGEDIHLFWHGHNDDLFVFDLEDGILRTVRAYEKVVHEQGYADHIIEDQYKDEIREFLDVVFQGKIPRYSLEKDKYVLSVIDKIEGK